jgi:4'-phosphopantetheinyl transferase
MSALTCDEIHLWLAYYDEMEDERLHGVLRALLSAAERRQEPRFHFARDRLRYLVTRALVRTVLSRYAPVAPGDWVFDVTAYGRPEIANAAASDAQLSFSISHTHSMIVLGVTRLRALGVDVENVEARRVSIDLAERFFAPEEAAALAGIAPERQQDRFFEYWTFKESYIKARGLGLHLSLDKFSFRYPHERGVEMAIHPELQDSPERWQFWQLRPKPEYLLAVCAERLGSISPTLIVRKVTPTVAEELLAPMFLRTSE